MARIGGWTTHKACGAWRGSLLDWWLSDILGHLISMVWGVGARVVTLIRWEENSWPEWRLDVRILCRMLNAEANNPPPPHYTEIKNDNKSIIKLNNPNL